MVPLHRTARCLRGPKPRVLLQHLKGEKWCERRVTLPVEAVIYRKGFIKSSCILMHAREMADQRRLALHTFRYASVSNRAGFACPVDDPDGSQSWYRATPNCFRGSHATSTFIGNKVEPRQRIALCLPVYKTGPCAYSGRKWRLTEVLLPIVFTTICFRNSPPHYRS